MVTADHRWIGDEVQFRSGSRGELRGEASSQESAGALKYLSGLIAVFWSHCADEYFCMLHVMAYLDPGNTCHVQAWISKLKLQCLAHETLDGVAQAL